MKKLISCLVAGALALSLSACSQTQNNYSYDLNEEAKAVLDTLPTSESSDLLRAFGILEQLHFEDAPTLQTELQDLTEIAEKYGFSDQLDATSLLSHLASDDENSPSLTNYRETGVQRDKEIVYSAILPGLYAANITSDKILNGSAAAITALAEQQGYTLTTSGNQTDAKAEDTEANSYKTLSLQWDKDNQLIRTSMVLEHLNLAAELDEEFKQFGPMEQLETTAGNHAVWMQQLTVAEHPVLSQLYSEDEQAVLQEFFQTVDYQYLYEKSEISGQIDGYPVLELRLTYADTLLVFRGPVFELELTITPMDFASGSYQQGLDTLQAAFIGNSNEGEEPMTPLILTDELVALKGE